MEVDHGMTWRLEDDDDDDGFRQGGTSAPRPVQQALEALMGDGNRLEASERPSLVLGVSDTVSFSRRPGLREVVVPRPPGGGFEDVVRVEPYGLFVVSSAVPDGLHVKGARFRQDQVAFLPWGWLESVSLVNVSLVDGASPVPGLAGRVARGPAGLAGVPGPVMAPDPGGAGWRARPTVADLLATIDDDELPRAGRLFRDALPGLIGAGNRLSPRETPSIVVVQRHVDSTRAPRELVATRPGSGRFEDVLRLEPGGLFLQGSRVQDEARAEPTILAFLPWDTIASAWLDDGRIADEPWKVVAGP